MTDNVRRILQDMRTAPVQGHDAVMAEIEQLRAENARLKADKEVGLRCKVSAKGAISIYGLGRWPITLYLSQFQRLDKEWEGIRAWVKAHQGELSVKED